MGRLVALALAGSMLALSGGQVAARGQDGSSEAIVPSPDMTVAAFLKRVDQLRVSGPEWTLSPEAGELFAAIASVGKAYRQNLADRLAAGQPVEACLPPEAEIGSDVLFQHLASYPPEAAARTSIRAAFSELVRQRFPCP